MSGGMVSFLAGLGGGYLQGMTQKRKNDQEDEDRAFQKQQRERTLREQADADSLKANMKMAGTTAQADPNMVPDASTDNRDVGLPGTAPAVQDGYRVAGKVVPDQASADAAVTSWNNPEARMTRMADVLTASGNPTAAIALSNSAMQNKIGGLQLTAAQRADVHAKYDDGLAPIDSFDGLTSYVSNSNGDGQGGAAKISAVPSADGKTVTINKLQPDGTAVPTALQFENSPAGLMQSKAMLSKSLSLGDKLSHLHQQFTEQQAATAAAQKAKVDTADIAEKTARAGYYDSLNDTKVIVAGGKGANAKPTVDRMSEADKLTFNDINKRREVIHSAMVKAQAEGSWDDTTPNAKQLKTNLNALNMQAAALAGKYSDDSNATPDPLGVRTSPSKGTAPRGTNPMQDAARIAPATQAASDAEAGKLVIRNEFGGDLSKATAGVAQLRAAVASAPNADSRTIMQGELSRLEAGIAASSAPTAAVPPATAPAPSPAVTAAPRGMQAAAGRGVINPTQADQAAAALPPLEVAGRRLDAARAANAAAAATLQRFGLNQRASNPDGFRAAVEAAKAAKEQQDQAESAYSSLATKGPMSTQAAFRFPRT